MSYRTFSDAKRVLDLGFGTGLWFWSSFLPSLERIDGLDLCKEALDECNRILTLDEASEGYRIAHAYVDSNFVLSHLNNLQDKKGNLIIQNFLYDWPEVISSTRYDLVTEYGGIGEVDTNQQFIDIVKKSANVLKPNGSMMFVNFLEKEVPILEKNLGRYTPDTLTLSTTLFEEAIEKAGMQIVDFHAIDNPEGMPIIQKFFYGYAKKL